MFSNPKITKIMHGCDSDLKYLVGDLGIVTVNLIDTARAFTFAQRIPNLITIQDENVVQTAKHIDVPSLAKLVKLLLNIELDKAC